MPVEQFIDSVKNASFVDVLTTFFNILEYPAITLFTAMLLEIVLPIGSNLRISALIPLFKKMANKVNRSENNLGQNVFASVFLPCFIIFIAFAILLLLNFIIDDSAVLSLLLLPFLLESKTILNTALKVKASLTDNNKSKAKEILQQTLTRDCSKLSELGINKALAEACGVSLFVNWFAIMVWFLILGIQGALLMQLVVAMDKAFSQKQLGYEHFGIFIHKFEQALLIPCSLALLLTMLFSISIHRIILNLKSHFHLLENYTTCLVHELLGSYANVTLGGPRYYKGQIFRFNKIGGSKEPDLKTPLKIYNKIRFSGIVFVCICVLIKTFFYTTNINL